MVTDEALVAETSKPCPLLLLLDVVSVVIGILDILIISIRVVNKRH